MKKMARHTQHTSLPFGAIVRDLSIEICELDALAYKHELRLRLSGEKTNNIELYVMMLLFYGNFMACGGGKCFDS